MAAGGAGHVRQGGFTYLGLIVTVAIIGLVGAATLKVDALLRRAAAEEELLEIGAAYSAALRSYADATPRGQPQLPPPSLQDLLKDPRYPGVRRHLRKIFVDPMTGKAAWGVIYASNPNGSVGGAGAAVGAASGAGTGIGMSGGMSGGGTGVLAVYSLSQARPLKIANFDARFQNLENKERISDWKFAATGQGVAQPGPLLAGQAAPGQPVPGQGAPAPSLFAPQPGASGQAQTQAPAQAGQPAPAEPPALLRATPAPTPMPTPAPAPPPETLPGDPPPANNEQDSQDGAHDPPSPPPSTASDSR